MSPSAMAVPRSPSARRIPWYQTLWEHNALHIVVSACVLIWLLYPTKAAAYSEISSSSEHHLSCDIDEPIKSVAIVGEPTRPKAIPATLLIAYQVLGQQALRLLIISTNLHIHVKG